MERRFKRLITSVAVCILILVCAGCGGNTLDENENENVSETVDSFSSQDSNTENPDNMAADSDIADGSITDNETADGDTADHGTDKDAENNSESGKEILIVYFSHSGNTHKLAEMLQAETDADVFRLTPVEEYGDDLFERAQDELNNGIRPELTELPEQEVIDQYDTILLGFPIWWYDLPMPVWTFLEGCDLSDKTIIPFFTHNGSSNGAGSLGTIEELCPDSTVQSDDALSIFGRSVDDSETEVKEWLIEIGLAQ